MFKINIKPGELYNENPENDDRNIHLIFEVDCQSPISMQQGNTVEEKIKSFIHDCQEAMDDSMRHWGDFTGDIECIKCSIGDEYDDGYKEEEIDIDKLYGY